MTHRIVVPDHKRRETNGVTDINCSCLGLLRSHNCSSVLLGALFNGGAAVEHEGVTFKNEDEHKYDSYGSHWPGGSNPELAVHPEKLIPLSRLTDIRSHK